jgi:hypothetical protein
MVRVGSSMSGSMSICSRLRETAQDDQDQGHHGGENRAPTLKRGRFIGRPPRCDRSPVFLAGNRDRRAVVHQLLPEGDHPTGQPLAFHLHPVAFADAHLHLAPGTDCPSSLTMKTPVRSLRRSGPVPAR